MTGGKFKNGAATAAFFSAISQDWSQDNSILQIKTDKNGDPIPDQVFKAARDTGLVKMVDGKLTGTINWACNGGQTLCQQTMDYFDNVVSANSDFLNISNKLTTDYTTANAFINYSANVDMYAAGHWNNSIKTISMNSNSNILQRAMEHEFGHALGLFHQGNYTENFMSYYGLGSSYHAIAPIITPIERNWLTDAYTPWYGNW